MVTSTTKKTGKRGRPAKVRANATSSTKGIDVVIKNFKIEDDVPVGLPTPEAMSEEVLAMSGMKVGQSMFIETNLTGFNKASRNRLHMNLLTMKRKVEKVSNSKGRKFKSILYPNGTARVWRIK